MARAVAATLAMGLALSSLPAGAIELIEFTKGPDKHWEVGDRSPTIVTRDGRLGVQLTVKKSPNTLQSYYVVAFETRTDKPVNFSARISDRPPQRTHFAARAEPNRPYQWGDHLPARTGTVYVMIRPAKN